MRVFLILEHSYRRWKQKMRLRKLNDDTHAVIDVMVAISIGIVFAALMVVAYIIWTLRTQMAAHYPAAAGVAGGTAAYNSTRTSVLNSLGNITTGFDQTIKIIIVAILVAVLAIALSYLMMLRQG